MTFAATPRPVHFLVPGSLDQRTGGYRYDARMVSGLRRLGWQVDVHQLEGSFPLGERGGKKAIERALRGVPDGAIVLIDGLAGGGLPMALHEHAKRLQLLAIVHHPLADETGVSPAHRRLLVDSETRALAACAGVIVTSDTTAGRVLDFGVAEGQVRTVQPGTKAATLARGPAAGQDPVLLNVGSVIPRKGHDILIDALDKVSDLSWTCICVGSMERDPAHAASVLNACNAKGLGERVLFPGECDDSRLEEFFDGSSLFVSASLYEGYGMAFAEALVRGLPVIGTTGGAIDATVPAGAGLLVAPGDSAALADALRALLEDPSRRTRMAATAGRCAAEFPTWDQAVQEFARAIHELASLPADASPGTDS